MIESGSDFLGKTKCHILPTTFVCNADCVYCYRHAYDYSGFPPFLRVSANITKNIETLRFHHIDKIEVVGGGEPTLNPDLITILEMIIAEYPGCYLKMFTNASKLIAIPAIDEVTIHRAHWDPEVNQRVMKFNQSPADMEVAAEFYRGRGVKKVRLSVPMVKGATDSPDKLEKLVKLTESFIDVYKVGALSPNTPNYEQFYQEYDYSHPKVDIDRKHSYQKAVVWAADNRFYSSYELKQEFDFENL